MFWRKPKPEINTAKYRCFLETAFECRNRHHSFFDYGDIHGMVQVLSKNDKIYISCIFDGDDEQLLPVVEKSLKDSFLSIRHRINYDLSNFLGNADGMGNFINGFTVCCFLDLSEFVVGKSSAYRILSELGKYTSDVMGKRVMPLSNNCGNGFLVPLK